MPSSRKKNAFQIEAARIDPDRFWSKVVKTDTCWLWRASRNNMGYGMFYVGDRCGRPVTALAHRVSFVLAHGPITHAVRILHRCDTPACVRPDHLFAGTQADNIADCIAKGRYKNPTAVINRAKTSCPRGHPYSPANTVVQRGRRHCRECRRQYMERYHQRQRVAS